MTFKNNIIDKGYAKNKTFFLLLVLLCVPFIQLGFNYYLSVQVLAFILALFIIPLKTYIKFVPVGFILLGLMCLPVIFAVNSDYVVHDILKTVREFICYAPIYCLIKYRHSVLQETKVNLNVRRMVPVLVFTLLIITILQGIFLKKGLYLSIPYEFFMADFGTLPGALDLKFSYIRPAATFGEPSYLGFVITSLLLVVLRIYEKSWLKNALIFSILLTAYLCESLSGQVAVFVLLFIYFIQSKIQIYTKFLLISVACLVVTIALVANLSSFSTIERLSNISDKKKESSGHARLAVPLKIASEVLMKSPIGVTNSQLGKVIGISTKDDLAFSGFSNGFFNLLINYGLTGILLLALLFLPIWNDLLIIAYIFLSTFFNGSFLVYDKGAIVVTSLYMVFYFSAEIKSRLIDSNV